ncbi:MAG: hypothetical protein H6993_10570 [Pseudomonadales bacterium]|nr:hypothetical protein [Pseudomonadales bacterium]
MNHMIKAGLMALGLLAAAGAHAGTETNVPGNQCDPQRFGGGTSAEYTRGYGPAIKYTGNAFGGGSVYCPVTVEEARGLSISSLTVDIVNGTPGYFGGSGCYLVSHTRTGQETARQWRNAPNGTNSAATLSFSPQTFPEDGSMSLNCQLNQNSLVRTIKYRQPVWQP